MNTRDNNDYFDLFHKYEKGLLSKEEVHDLEFKLKNDPALNSSFEDYKIGNVLIRNYEQQNISKLLKEIDYDLFERQLFWKKAAAIGFISLITLAVGYYFYTSRTEKTTENQKITRPITNNIIQEENIQSENNTQVKPVDQLPKSTKNSVTEKINTPDTIRNSITQDQVFTSVPNDNHPLASNKTALQEPNVPQSINRNCIIEVSITTTGTCNGKNDGKIILSNLKGGNLPYNVHLNKDVSFIVNQNNYTIDALKQGNYNILITDNLSTCTKRLESIEVKTLAGKYCIEEINSAININLNEKFSLNEMSFKRVIKVFDLGGKLVFEKTIASNENFEWDGNGQNGQTLPIQVYFISIYDDNENLIGQGNITITNN